MRNLPAKYYANSDHDLAKYFDEFFNKKLFDNVEMGLSSFAPVVNIQESKEGYHVEAELPGLEKENVDVNIKDDYLIIKGEKRGYNEEKKDQYHRIERSHGSFYRAIALPSDIDKEKINAELKNGVLKIDIMKAVDVNAAERKIAIR